MKDFVPSEKLQLMAKELEEIEAGTRDSYSPETLAMEPNLKLRTRNQESTDVAIKQTEALEVLSTSVQRLADFLDGGGLQKLLAGYIRSQAVKDILGGIAAHSGRGVLDANVMEQNALEIPKVIERIFAGYEAELKKPKGDPEIKDPEKTTAEYFDSRGVRLDKEGNPLIDPTE